MIIQRCEECGSERNLVAPLDKRPPQEEWRRWIAHYAMLMLIAVYDDHCDLDDLHEVARNACLVINDARNGE